MNKKVAIIGSNSIHTIRYLHNISHAFDSIVLITNQYIDNLVNNITQYQIDFQLKNYFASKKIAKILIKHNVEIVHIHQANSYAFHTIRAIKKYQLNCKIILTTWGSDILVLPHQNLINKKIVEFNLKNANVITSDSLYMSYKIIQLMPQVQELHLINFGIDIPPELPNINYKQNIIFSNRLHKDLYQIDKIIIAFAKLIKIDMYQDYQLVIAGSGVKTKYLQQLAKDLKLNQNQIKFIGFVTPDILKFWYKIAKIFVSIPISDAVSISLMEAMAFGCYPILSNIPANLEFIIHNFNGIINQQSSYLTNDIIMAIDIYQNTTQIQAIIQQNYTIIHNLGNAQINSQKFIKLLQ